MKAIIAGFLMLTVSTAFADAKRIMAMPSIRKQIYAEARNEGALRGLKRPSMRLERHGDRISATILSVGRAWPSPMDTRLAQKAATFKVVQVSEGKLAQPVKDTTGHSWHQIYRTMGH